MQLFNAVREHQTDVRTSLQESGTTEAKRARIEKEHASSLGFLERLEKKKKTENENQVRFSPVFHKRKLTS